MTGGKADQPALCYPCVIGLCRHEDCAGSTPAVTVFRGTALCADCARRAAGQPEAGQS